MRLLLVDDHRLVAEALALALAPAHRVLDVLCDGAALHPWLVLHEVDAVLLDSTLPHCNLSEVIRHVRRSHPNTIVLVMSIHDDHCDWPGLHRFGAHGVVSKTRALCDLRVTLDLIATSGAPLKDGQQETLNAALTPRQIDVLKAIARDRPRKEIAHELDLSEARVNEHVAELKRRLGVRTSAALVLRAVEEGWIEPRVAPAEDSDGGS